LVLNKTASSNLAPLIAHPVLQFPDAQSRQEEGLRAGEAAWGGKFALAIWLGSRRVFWPAPAFSSRFRIPDAASRCFAHWKMAAAMHNRFSLD